MSLRAIADVVGVSHMTVKHDLDAVKDFTPEVDGEPREPLRLSQTRSEFVAERRAEGHTLRAIAAELGVAESTVQGIASGKDSRMAPDAPVEWPATRNVIQSLEEFAQGDARRVAASVPERNRRATAKRLRQVGRFLGSIAYELEGATE